MYNVTRQEASDTLQISVRSVDRYIKAGKLRIKKEGKNILINAQDIQNLNGGTKVKQHVIIQDAPRSSTSQNGAFKEKNQSSKTELSTGKEALALESIYADLRKEIEKKDDLIQTLALRVGKAEEIAKNSISINDFKKSQFLLEESKTAINNDLKTLTKQKNKLDKDLKYEKQVKILFVILSIVLFIMLFSVWVYTI